MRLSLHFLPLSVLRRLLLNFPPLWCPEAADRVQKQDSCALVCADSEPPRRSEGPINQKIKNKQNGSLRQALINYF